MDGEDRLGGVSRGIRKRAAVFFSSFHMFVRMGQEIGQKREGNGKGNGTGKGKKEQEMG